MLTLAMEAAPKLRLQHEHARDEGQRHLPPQLLLRQEVKGRNVKVTLI